MGRGEDGFGRNEKLLASGGMRGEGEEVPQGNSPGLALATGGWAGHPGGVSRKTVILRKPAFTGEVTKSCHDGFCLGIHVQRALGLECRSPSAQPKLAQH